MILTNEEWQIFLYDIETGVSRADTRIHDSTLYRYNIKYKAYRSQINFPCTRDEIGENRDKILIAHRCIDRDVDRHPVISRKIYDSKQYENDDNTAIYERVGSFSKFV